MNKEYILKAYIPTDELGKGLININGQALKEKIEKGVFSEALEDAQAEERKILLLKDHKKNDVLGSTEDILKLAEDDKGLNIEIDLREYKELYESLESNVKGFSFGFNCIAEEVENGVRSLKKIKLNEVSILENKEAFYNSEVEFRALEKSGEELRMIKNVQGQIVEKKEATTVVKLQKVESIIAEDNYKILDLIEFVSGSGGTCNKVVIDNMQQFDDNRTVEVEASATLENKAFNTAYGVLKINKKDDSVLIENEYEKLVNNALAKALVIELSNQFAPVIETDIVKEINGLSFEDINSIAFLNNKDWTNLYNLKDSSGEKLIKLKDGQAYFEGIRVVAASGIKNSFLLDLKKVKCKYRNLSDIKRVVNSENAKNGIIELVKSIEVCYI